jgi:hypothetical protein
MGDDIPERVADLGQTTQVVVLLHQFPIASFFVLAHMTDIQRV